MSAASYMFVPFSGNAPVTANPSAVTFIQDEQKETALFDRMADAGIEAPVWLASKGSAQGVLVLGSMKDVHAVGNMIAANFNEPPAMRADFGNAARGTVTPFARTRANVMGSYGHQVLAVA